MRNIYIQTITALLCLLPISSCEKVDNLHIGGNGSIYGTVFDLDSREPIANATVSLRPGGETVLTGRDGMYEFLYVEDGDYTLVVSKAEYSGLVDNDIIHVRNGMRVRRDVSIEKNPTYLTFTNSYGQNISYLDFGDNINNTTQSFNIFNGGTISINCILTYSCNWIKRVSSIPPKISPGQTIYVEVEIDRSQLRAGNNVVDLAVSSNNGSNILTIMAIGQNITPQVETLPITYIDGTITPWCNTFNAKVTNVGNPAYHTRGFCFSSTNKTPTINDNKIVVSGNGLGEFNYTNWDLPPHTVTYYVRAWVMYGADNKVQYGSTQSFTYNDV